MQSCHQADFIREAHLPQINLKEMTAKTVRGLLMTTKKPYRTVRVEFDGELWDRTQKVAEIEDRYLKNLITEVLRGEINRRFEQYRSESIESTGVSHDPGARTLLNISRSDSDECVSGSTGEAAS